MRGAVDAAAGKPPGRFAQPGAFAMAAAGAVLLAALAAPALAQGAPPAVSLPPTPPRVLRYNHFWYAFYFVSAAWHFLGLALAVRCGLGAWILRRAQRIARRPYAQIALCYAGLALAMTVWRRPAALTAYLVERAYGFATLTPARWLADAAVGYLTGVALYTPVVLLGYWLLRRSPRRWWLLLWAGTIPLSLVAVVLYPVFIDPLYNRFRPMPDSPLRRELIEMADRAGIAGARVYIVDMSRRTRKLNAYVTGLGPSKRIVLWDTTLKALPDDEVVAIAGHEMGHYALGHVWWGFAASVGGALILLAVLAWVYPLAVSRLGPRAGIRDVSDPAGLPLAMLLLTGLLFLQEPAASAFSRWQEHQADRYGLELTHLNVPTARAFVAFVQHDYADPAPPSFITLWMGSHPALRDRIRFALDYHPWIGSANARRGAGPTPNRTASPPRTAPR